MERFKDNPEVLKDKNKYLRSLEGIRLSSESADSWCDISARGLMEYRTCPGDQLVDWKTRGYSTILDILTVGVLPKIWVDYFFILHSQKVHFLVHLMAGICTIQLIVIKITLHTWENRMFTGTFPGM